MSKHYTATPAAYYEVEKFTGDITEWIWKLSEIMMKQRLKDVEEIHQTKVITEEDVKAAKIRLAEVVESGIWLMSPENKKGDGDGI